MLKGSWLLALWLDERKKREAAEALREPLFLELPSPPPTKAPEKPLEVVEVWL